MTVITSRRRAVTALSQLLRRSSVLISQLCISVTTAALKGETYLQVLNDSNDVRPSTKLFDLRDRASLLAIAVDNLLLRVANGPLSVCLCWLEQQVAFGTRQTQVVTPSQLVETNIWQISWSWTRQNRIFFIISASFQNDPAASLSDLIRFSDFGLFKTCVCQRSQRNLTQQPWK